MYASRDDEMVSSPPGVVLADEFVFGRTSLYRRKVVLWCVLWGPGDNGEACCWSASRSALFRVVVMGAVRMGIRVLLMGGVSPLERLYGMWCSFRLFLSLPLPG